MQRRKTPRPEDLLSDEMCRCGHALGDHRATGKDCLHGSDEMGRNPTCACQKFRHKPTTC